MAADQGRGLHAFGFGVEYDATMDVLTLWTGPHSDLSIRPGRRLAEILAAGFRDVEARERLEDRPAEHHVCSWCDKPIRWVRLKGLWHPVDAAPHKNGTIKIGADGLTATMTTPFTEPTTPVYRSHVETCHVMAMADNRYAGPPAEGEYQP